VVNRATDTAPGGHPELPSPLGPPSPGVSQSDEAGRAAFLYARIFVILQECLQTWQNEELRSWLATRAKRAVQDVIDAAARNDRPFRWLVHHEDPGENLVTHSANVALLSILIGLRARLPRASVRDLGVAGLFHDLGRITVPAHVRFRAGKFGEEELREVKQHPIHGANMLLGLETSNASLLKTLVVVFEHNIDSNGYPRREWPAGLHLFSRIVAIADAYDAMTTRRSFRSGRTPDEAMREIVRGAGTRYDADLVEVFQSLMGAYPVGTLVRLDTSELGLVAEGSTESPTRPGVLLVIDRDGRRLDGAALLDLRERDAEGRHLRTIVSSEDPAAHGIHVPGYVGVAP
jgi:HD-GYP domain-containing protein (c-di-GMP phosphodiesterase class II)